MFLLLPLTLFSTIILNKLKMLDYGTCKIVSTGFLKLVQHPIHYTASTHSLLLNAPMIIINIILYYKSTRGAYTLRLSESGPEPKFIEKFFVQTHKSMIKIFTKNRSFFFIDVSQMEEKCRLSQCLRILQKNPGSGCRRG